MKLQKLKKITTNFGFSYLDQKIEHNYINFLTFTHLSWNNTRFWRQFRSYVIEKCTKFLQMFLFGIFCKHNPFWISVRHLISVKISNFGFPQKIDFFRKCREFKNAGHLESNVTYNSSLKLKIVFCAESAAKISRKGTFGANLGLCNVTILWFWGPCNATILKNFGSTTPDRAFWSI